jgi:hypothetical protein
MDSYRAAGRRWKEFMAIGQKFDHSKNIRFYITTAQFLQDMVPQLSSGLRSGSTISHSDLHIGNLYVDDDFNITFLIDWSSSSTGPLTELMTTPTFVDPRMPSSRELVTAFRSGFGHAAGVVQASDSSPWRKSEGILHFSRLVRLLSRSDYSLFEKKHLSCFTSQAPMMTEARSRFCGFFTSAQKVMRIKNYFPSCNKRILH